MLPLTTSLAINFVVQIMHVVAFRFTSTPCSNRHYCYSAEIRYMAFDALNNTYLNSSRDIISTYMTKSPQQCMEDCTKKEKCQSANYYARANRTSMFCDLLSTNRWANGGNVTCRSNSTHYFVEVCA